MHARTLHLDLYYKFKNYIKIESSNFFNKNIYNIYMYNAIILHIKDVQCNHSISFVIMQSFYMLNMYNTIILHKRSFLYE